MKPPYLSYLVAILLICLSYSLGWSDDSKSVVKPNEPSKLAANVRPELQAPSSKQAEQIVRHSIQGTLEKLFHKDKKSYLGVRRGFIFDIHYSPDSIKFTSEPLQLTDRELKLGITARYEIQVSNGISVKAKRYEHTFRYEEGDNCIAPESLPYVYPWSSLFEYADLFGPTVVEFFADQEPLCGGFLEGVHPITALDRAKLFNEDTNGLVSHIATKVVKAASTSLLEATHPQKRSYFISTTSLLQSGLTAHRAPSPKLAFNWKSIYAQNTEMTVMEVAGSHQVWIEEFTLSQVDKINGVLARGAVHAAIRGFSRKGSIAIQTEYLGRQVKVAPSSPWSSWDEPSEHRFKLHYTVLSDGGIVWQQPSELWGVNGESTKTAFPTIEIDKKDLASSLDIMKYVQVELPDEDLTRLDQALRASFE